MRLEFNSRIKLPYIRKTIKNIFVYHGEEIYIKFPKPKNKDQDPLFSNIDNIQKLTNKFYDLELEMRIITLALSYVWDKYPNYCKENDVAKITSNMMVVIDSLKKYPYWEELYNDVQLIIDDQMSKGLVIK